eukprot:GHVP01062141.1.p1 GENE.GHVP01062141.1~~GHVP01062141.1.p1  ORF type:complete len:196 (+),score=40.07 GHVP01062141.1:86-589(+)
MPGKSVPSDNETEQAVHKVFRWRGNDDLIDKSLSVIHWRENDFEPNPTPTESDESEEIRPLVQRQLLEPSEELPEIEDFQDFRLHAEHVFVVPTALQAKLHFENIRFLACGQIRNQIQLKHNDIPLEIAFVNLDEARTQTILYKGQLRTKFAVFLKLCDFAHLHNIS